MAFWSLFLVASTPSIQVLLIGLLGAYLASGHSNILTASTRKDMNKIVFAVFTPSLMFANLAKSVTLEDIISWWFMPVNIAITFVVGGVLGWIVVKILKPERHLEGLVMATCSAGNLGNLLLIIVPAVCSEEGNPFGDRNSCSIDSFSYVSFSMALGGFFIWTHSFSLIKKDSKTYHDALLMNGNENSGINDKDQTKVPLLSHRTSSENKLSSWEKLKGTLHQIAEELMAPPTVAAFIGFFVGAITPLKYLVIGDNAPLRVIQDSVQLLGDGTIPCITLIMGGNLTRGFRKSLLKPMAIISIICARYVILPLVGIAVVKTAYELGFLPHDPLYRYVLMIQFAVPPAMNIGTMAQLLDVGQDECSVIFLWTYLVAALSLTVWSTVFMSILS
ncbi:uncharacterized protein A4U43_C07F24030 [Asparagus officinalis]|uniref:Auxin efflux carrier family protein n=2 Tax=Asparagus officinalis TaxID=4686 RepID=A0A5P1EJP4_ASPOF|nr:uncharacterized protein A4U43_C07F24030 [Asparagus officinalis]